ncbi:MAG: hypothetical protein ABSF35_20025 [Polyangia bacterium]
MPADGAPPDSHFAAGNALEISGEQLQELLDAVLSRGRPLRFRARGFSMGPLVQDRDVITISPLAGRRPGTGDIIACRLRPSRRLVVHRVRAVRSDGLLVQGDSAFLPDGMIPLGDVLGLLTLAERDGVVIYRTRHNHPATVRHLAWIVRRWRNRAAGVAHRLRERWFSPG